MKYLLTLMLFGALLTSCSSASTVGNATQDVPSGNRNIASVATEGKVTEEVATQEASGGVVMTVEPPPIILKPIQGNTATPDVTPTPSAREVGRHLPASSVVEETDAVTFTSPQSATIVFWLPNSIMMILKRM